MKMSAIHTETQDIATAILQLLKQQAPCDPVDVIESLSEKNEYDPWRIREVMWDLISKDAAELTWGRQLKLGTQSKFWLADSKDSLNG